MIYLHKIIPLITSPLFFVLTLSVILIILRKSKLIKLKNSLLFLSFLTLFLFSNPLISNKLVKYHLKNGGKSRFLKIKWFVEDVINLVYQVLQLYLYKRHLVKRIEKNNFGRREEW